ncbi:DUF4333 domain-containing protein [Leptolyngbya cf. ectocarpi LEGE 11479]|uniref:DUF4333 domain-containing protein n=1 Tax=Leptolyngbya cf. ectocarpi LEGE 11479 TaxID=1828722 RepID=A0A929FCT7_LEPEC|nr:DUF4333 domain-containing protein [Leptolyngbya ectocarpi]MBE9069938.1 DUF4333 domain-containing protein [Leptolyngbya cf. ectocarpi LEGE 11479]
MVAMVRLGALVGLIFLSSCSQYLNMSRIEADIQDDIERQGRRLTLKDVICPNRVVKQAEAYFRCVGELPDGGQFTINVTQQDDQGTLDWDVPSSKVLINLASLEEKIQAEIRDAVGKSLAVDCRDTYRVNQRGDSFECDVVGAGIVAAGRVESVLVKVNGQSNLEWQEVLIGAVPAAPQAAASGAAASAEATDEKPDVATAAANSTPAAAEEDEDED